jgi:AAA family ATP:ADP antiporter
MGVQGGVENLPWLFSATFAAMLAVTPLFGWAAARLPRRRLVPWTYLFFIANVLVFYALFASGVAPPAVARAFFVWVSVFNLFVVSLFWSLMADLFRPEQAARLFGFLSAGGSCGALAGPTLTALLAAPFGTANLLLVSCGFLGLALLCIAALIRGARTGPPAGPVRSPAEQGDSIGGTTWSGIAEIPRSPYLLGIVAYVLLSTVLFGFAYLELARMVSAAYNDPAQRTALFAQMDLAVNVITLLGQLLVVAKFVETVVFRSGDAASGWVYAALKGLGLGLAGLAAAAIPGVILWIALGLWLGRQYASKNSVPQDARA